VSDAMSRFAYPATSAKPDISWHGSDIAKNEPKSKFLGDLRRAGNLGHSDILFSMPILHPMRGLRQKKKGQISWKSAVQMKEMPGGGGGGGVLSRGVLNLSFLPLSRG